MGCQDDLTNPAHRLVTHKELLRDLRSLGVETGQTLLVHASVGSIGLIHGGASAVVSALCEAVGDTGNIVTPTMTMENSKTSRAHQRFIAEMTADEVEKFERDMPGFDKDATPSTSGALGEALRTFAGAIRSAHPQSSFAAIGPAAEKLMADHVRECHLGEQSPLGKLYEMSGASVLLLGVGCEACTAFHLAEYRYKDPDRSPPRKYWCKVIVDGQAKWVDYEDVVLDDRDFQLIGESLDLQPASAVKKGYVGNADSRLVPLVQAVDHAKRWMAKHRV
jgi:aminoglycoside 3-N-acetyltransferase